VICEIDPDGENAIAILDASGRFTLSLLAVPNEKGMTYPSVQGIAVIDWILIPASWEFRAYNVPNVDHSDHRPVSVEVGLPRL
jgi:endonuclease/exonuclease/phosphatase family metal-dependent hydrolase